MALGVLVMVLAAFDYVPILLSKALEWSIFILNKIINWVASLEQFIIQDIPFTIYLLICSYLVIITLIIWCKKPNYNKMIAVLLSIIILQITYFATIWNIQNQKELIVFNVKKQA